MPFLSIIRIPLVETRSFTQRFSDSTQNLCACKLGRKRRRVLLFACDTLFPETGFLPVTWHIRDMVNSVIEARLLLRARTLPEAGAVFNKIDGYLDGSGPHFSPLFYCGDAMPHPALFLLGQSAQHSVDYACALFGRINKAGHDLSPSRYERW